MIKVFYSVDYMILGSDKKHKMWFDSLKEAIKFSKADYRDNPVRHIFNNETLIKMAEQLIELQKN